MMGSGSAVAKGGLASSEKQQSRHLFWRIFNLAGAHGILVNVTAEWTCPWRVPGGRSDRQAVRLEDATVVVEPVIDPELSNMVRVRSWRPASGVQCSRAAVNAASRNGLRGDSSYRDPLTFACRAAMRVSGAARCRTKRLRRPGQAHRPSGSGLLATACGRRRKAEDWLDIQHSAAPRPTDSG